MEKELVKKKNPAVTQNIRHKIKGCCICQVNNKIQLEFVRSLNCYFFFAFIINNKSNCTHKINLQML